MRITKIESFNVPPRWNFVKISTDEGLFGWGEPVLEGKAATVKTCVEEMADFLIGKDPLCIEDHWNVLYRSGFYRGGGVLMSALSGIDQALWDIKGKYFDAPAWQLMGGKCRDKMAIYSWIGGERPDDVADQAQNRLELGFPAVKMNATNEMQYVDSHKKIDSVLNRVAAIRDKVGNDLGIALDFHGRVHKPMAKVLAKKLEPFDLMFIEEPVLCDNMEAFRDVARHTTIPIATGERLFSRWQFKELLHSGYVDIIQPDLSHAGGLTEVKKIASMAEAYDVALAPHCPLGPLALASCLQVDATCHNAIIQEQSLLIHYNQSNDLLDYMTNPELFTYTDGFVDIPQEPGLGVHVNEDLVRKLAGDHRWRNEAWRHEDGSVAEW